MHTELPRCLGELCGFLRLGASQAPSAWLTGAIGLASQAPSAWLTGAFVLASQAPSAWLTGAVGFAPELAPGATGTIRFQ